MFYRWVVRCSNLQVCEPPVCFSSSETARCLELRPLFDCFIDCSASWRTCRLVDKGHGLHFQKLDFVCVCVYVFRCIVWTGDNRVFFFNPTIHLSVWERPGELIGRDISHIIEDPPHKRKRMTPGLSIKTFNHKTYFSAKTQVSVHTVQLVSLFLTDSSSSFQSSNLHGNDKDNEHEHNSKRNR